MDSLDAAIWEEKKYENMIKELAQANCPFLSNTKSSDRIPRLIRPCPGGVTL